MATIGQIAKKSGISAHTLRYYEKEGLVRPPRNGSGVRDYDEYSQRIIYSIMCYRRAGISLTEIKELLYNDDNQRHLEVIEKRKAEVIQEIENLKETLDYLNFKIERFGGDTSNRLEKMEEWVKE